MIAFEVVSNLAGCSIDRSVDRVNRLYHSESLLDIASNILRVGEVGAVAKIFARYSRGPLRVLLLRME